MTLFEEDGRTYSRRRTFAGYAGYSDRSQVEGVTGYVLTGMGHIHYYFQLDQRVVWLAVSPQVAGQSLEELIRKLQ